MSGRSSLDLGGGMTVETYVEKWNGRVYIGYANGVSAMFAGPKELRRFLKLPAKIPSRERLDAWLDGLDPNYLEIPDSSQLQPAGLGPVDHGGEDPTKNTRMIT